jgi:penicillin-binding protein 2
MGKYKEKEINFEEVVFDNSTLKNLDYRELPTSKKTFFIVGATVSVIVMLVVVQVFFLNFSEQGFYEARASANVTREINVPTYRSVIVDRFGEQLVKNKSSFSIFLDVSSVINSSSGLEVVLKDMSNILNVSEEELIVLIKDADLEKTNWVSMARNISQKEAIEIKGLNQEFLQVIDDYEREYIDGSVFSHVLGYTGITEKNKISGISGLEFEYDERIRGKDGRYIFFEDALGEVLDKKVVNEPQPSERLEITIDADLQRYFHKRLKSGLQSLGRDTGVGLAIDPRNGEILALISLPSFDNNVFIDRERSEERSNLLNNKLKPLFNRATTGIYSPGSTIKPLVTLSALSNGIVNPSTRIFSKGKLEIPNIYNPDLPSIFVDWKPHGWVDSASALARSSNIYFYLVGGGLPNSVSAWEIVQGQYDKLGLGINELNISWKDYGFGEETGIDLPFESIGFLPTSEEKEERTGDIWRLGDTYNVSIGQGDLLTTPLQLLNFLASIGNGGKLYKPFLNKDMLPEVIVDYSNLEDEIIVVQKGLKDAVSKPYGTIYSLKDLPVNVAGKTGTPQTFNNRKLNAFFAGYAPAENPEIAILVLVENAREGSLNTLPIAYDVFEWYYHNRIKN